MEIIKKYMGQDMDNPKYLFYGSSKKRNLIQSNIKTLDTPIFILPNLITAAAYAFKDTIKSNSYGLNYRIIIDNDNTFPVMILENVNIEDEIIGYIYVFENTKDFVKDKHSRKYRCNKELIPIDILEVKYNDFKEYFEVK